MFFQFFGGGGRSSNWSDLVATSRKFGNSTRIVVSQVFWEKTFSRGVYKSYGHGCVMETPDPLKTARLL